MCETRLDKAPPPPTGTTAWPCHRPVNFACNSPSASRYFVPVRDAVSLVFLNCMRNLSGPVPAAALHTGGAWCAVVACRDSASRSVQNSPCWASWWRERYKTLPACRKSAKLSHFGRAGRVLYRTCGEKGRAGRVLYRTCGEGGCAWRFLSRSSSAWFLLGELCCALA